MSWNYRVIHRIYEDFDEESYAIHEVFYNDDGEPHLVSEDAVAPQSETLGWLDWVLKFMIKALSKPILEYADFEEGGKYYTDTEDLV
jgi:hypothetical protein